MTGQTTITLALGISLFAACGDDSHASGTDAGTDAGPLPTSDRLNLRLSATGDGGYELVDGEPITI